MYNFLLITFSLLFYVSASFCMQFSHVQQRKFFNNQNGMQRKNNMSGNVAIINMQENEICKRLDMLVAQNILLQNQVNQMQVQINQLVGFMQVQQNLFLQTNNSYMQPALVHDAVTVPEQAAALSNINLQDQAHCSSPYTKPYFPQYTPNK